MKALSLWQPWASAIAVGAKRIETRHWSTRYRGPLAIHAAKRCIHWELREYASRPEWRGALRAHLGLEAQPLWTRLPFGAIVATCNLIDCLPTQQFSLGELVRRRNPPGEVCDFFAWSESDMGNFALGRFGWVLRDVVPFQRPIPYRGAQGLFEIPHEVIEEVKS